MKKVLIAYATAGIGHKKAAFAIKEALEESAGKDVDVKIIDVLHYTGPFFKRFYCASYLLMINKIVALWGLFYYSLDIKLLHRIFYPFRKYSHVINSKRLRKFLLDYKPDVVVSTHFLLPDVCTYVEKKYGLKMHVINVITDYRPHSFWISESIDTYFVGHEEVKEELVKKWDISPQNIEVTGIPVEPKFCEKHDKALARKKMNIAVNSFTVLLSGGGYGVGPLFELTEGLNRVGFPLTAIVICGHNEKLFDQLENFKKNANINIVNVGYVNNVDELIAASDICLGKAGGISTTESFAQDTPFIFIRPIPGQERGNTDLFVKIGVGIELKKVNDIQKVVEDMYSHPEKLKVMRENIRRARKTDAAGESAKIILSLLNRSKT